MKPLVTSLGWLALVSCAGVGPTPDEVAGALPPAVELTDAQRAEVTRLTEQAMAELEAEDFEAADISARAAREIDPRAALAIAVQARCAMAWALRSEPPELGPWQRAEGLLRLARRIAPTDAVIGRMHVSYLEADGHLSAASAVADELLAQDPDNYEVLADAARLQYELGDEEDALPLLERIIELDPGADQMRYRLAQCRLRLARTLAGSSATKDEKLAAFKEVARVFEVYRERVPGDAAGYAGEATARFAGVRLKGEPDEGELDTILGLFERARDLDPLSPEPEFNRGVVLESAERADEAQAAYRVALERDPEHLPSLLNLAASLADSGREEDAVPLCERALRLNVTPGEKSRLEAFLAARR